MCQNKATLSLATPKQDSFSLAQGYVSEIRLLDNEAACFQDILSLNKQVT